MSQLETNTTTLQTILDKVNALPESGGGSVETCTVTIQYSFEIRNVSGYYTCLENGEIVPKRPSSNMNFDTGYNTLTLDSCVCPSILWMHDCAYFSDLGNCTITGGITLYDNNASDAMAAFIITGDGTITYD